MMGALPIALKRTTTFVESFFLYVSSAESACAGYSGVLSVEDVGKLGWFSVLGGSPTEGEGGGKLLASLELEAIVECAAGKPSQTAL
jgi:hypothetical protein